MQVYDHGALLLLLLRLLLLRLLLLRPVVPLLMVMVVMVVMGGRVQQPRRQGGWMESPRLLQRCSASSGRRGLVVDGGLVWRVRLLGRELGALVVVLILGLGMRREAGRGWWRHCARRGRVVVVVLGGQVAGRPGETAALAPLLRAGGEVKGWKVKNLQRGNFHLIKGEIASGGLTCACAW